MDLLLPWILSHIIDDIVPTKALGQVYFWGAIMLICAIIGISFNIIANRMSTGISRFATRRIRHDLFKKISYLSANQVDKYTLPSLMSRLTSDTYYVHQMLDRMQRIGVRAPILLIGGILVTLTLEPALTLVLLCILPVIVLVVFIISKKGIPLYTATQSAVDKLVRKIQETMTGIRVIKALSKSEYEKQRFDEVNSEVIKNEQKAGMLMNISNPAMQFLLNLGLTLVIVFGAFRVNDGITKPGKIIAFLSYFTIILNAMMIITRIFIMFSKGLASGKRIAEILELEEDMSVEADDTCKSEKSSDYHIEFNKVSFSYNKRHNNIEDINFRLRKGETLGIIGATGSGKSTIINLLLRFYDADEGEILINGIPIKMIPPETLYTLFGVVFQNDFLYADSIYENIDFGRELSREAVEKAANAAQADFIYDKDNSFEHMLTIKGSNLSGGQKQRLLISRALAANPDILILDDASSALDYKTDAALRHALYKDFRSTTCIIVAQRISSIMNSDHIIMLDNGRIIGSGTHEELLQNCPDYKTIYDIQMGGGHNEEAV